MFPPLARRGRHGVVESPACGARRSGWPACRAATGGQWISPAGTILSRSAAIYGCPELEGCLGPGTEAGKGMGIGRRGGAGRRTLPGRPRHDAKIDARAPPDPPGQLTAPPAGNDALDHRCPKARRDDRGLPGARRGEARRRSSISLQDPKTKQISAQARREKRRTRTSVSLDQAGGIKIASRDQEPDDPQDRAADPAAARGCCRRASCTW